MEAKERGTTVTLKRKGGCGLIAKDPISIDQPDSARVLFFFSFLYIGKRINWAM